MRHEDRRGDPVAEELFDLRLETSSSSGYSRVFGD